MPPSLRNIFKEIKSDLGQERLRTDFTDLAEQNKVYYYCLTINAPHCIIAPLLPPPTNRPRPTTHLIDRFAIFICNTICVICTQDIH